MMQTFLLACYLCLQLTNLSEDLTQSAMLKKDKACDQCLTGLFDHSELLSHIEAQPDRPMAANHALIEALEERLMLELSRSSMRARVQQKEEELKREIMLEEQVKKVHSTVGDMLTMAGSTMKTMQEDMMQDLRRMSMEMMEQLQHQHMQLTRELEMLATKHQGSLVNEVETMKEDLDEMRNVPTRNSLKTNMKLMTHEPLVSENGRYKALLLTDGNLVIIDMDKDRVGKEVGTAGQSLGPEAHLIVEPEGSLAIRTGHGAANAWSTPQDPEGDRYDHILKLENDGQLVMYNMLNRRVWTSGFV